MQFQNKRKLVVVGSIVIFVIVVFAVTSLVSNRKSANNISASGVYYDPLSHQTVSNPAGKAPDTFGTANDMPVYLGFSNLLSSGLTLNQLNYVKTGFYNYSKSVGGIKEISVDISTIKLSHDNTDPNANFVLEFKIRTDRKNDFIAQVQYPDILSARVVILNPTTRAQIFDSGVINS